MTAESALKAVTDTDEINDQYQREPGGKFTPGNKGGPGGSRPGSGRKPKPKDPSLLRQLYDILDESAPRALERLTEFIESSDEKISLKACAEILRKVLPESKLLASWEGEEGQGDTWRGMQEYGQFLTWKREMDVRELEDKKTDPPEPDQEFDEKEKTGNG